MLTRFAPTDDPEVNWELKDPSPIEYDSSIIGVAANLRSILFTGTAWKNPNEVEITKVANTEATQNLTINERLLQYLLKGDSD